VSAANSSSRDATLSTAWTRGTASAMRAMSTGRSRASRQRGARVAPPAASLASNSTRAYKIVRAPVEDNSNAL